MVNSNYLTESEKYLRVINSANEHLHALEGIVALAPPMDKAKLNLTSSLRTLQDYYASEFKKAEEKVKQDPPKLISS